MHHRLRPVRHRFHYRVFSLYLDLDELAAVDRKLRLLSVDRFNVLSFHNADHGPRDGTPLKPWVEAELRRGGLDVALGRVQLLAFPRLWGYVFNPLSVYFCHDETGRLAAILYEVKNTFGGQEAYALPVETGPTVRHTCAKRFTVSPFIAMDARYRFHLRPPAAGLDLVIHEHDAEGRFLVASHKARRRPLDDASLLRALAANPAMTQKVIGGIHLEALRLWLKGAPVWPKPAADRG